MNEHILGKNFCHYSSHNVNSGQDAAFWPSRLWPAGRKQIIFWKWWFVEHRVPIYLEADLMSASRQGLLCEGSFVDVRICCADHSASDGLGAHRLTMMMTMILVAMVMIMMMFQLYFYNVTHQGGSGCSFALTFGTKSSPRGQWGRGYGQSPFSMLTKRHSRLVLEDSQVLFFQGLSPSAWLLLLFSGLSSLTSILWWSLKTSTISDC